jgi:hypothetical protein
VNGVLQGPSDAIGYRPGTGGTVTQLTSKATTVILSEFNGQITTHNATLNAGDEVTFKVTNSLVTNLDHVFVTHSSGGTGGSYMVWGHSAGAGEFYITISNVSAGNLSEALVLNFIVLKGATT